jgi:SNF2 family DNA or RNA helicase
MAHAHSQLLAQGCALKGFQREGSNWLVHVLSNRCGGILADEMGLGKTIQTLACLSYMHSSGLCKGPFLVICPLSCAGNWVREAKRFVPHMTVAKLCGSAQERKHILDDDRIWYGLRDIIVTTYETAVSTDYYFNRHFWGVLVLDEAHKIKDEATQVRQALDTFQSAGRILLTGTPVQNKLSELHTLLRFLWPDVLARDSDVFEQAVQLSHVSTNEVSNTGTVVDAGLVSKIRSLLEMLMLRRRKEQVMTLPPKVFHDVWLPLSPLQTEWYKTVLNCRGQANERGIRALLCLVTRLRQLCCHPRCLGSSDTRRDQLSGYPAVDGAKLRELVEQTLSDTVIAQGSKLAFLDKLLGHLHAQNMGINNEWRKAFVDRRKKPLDLRQLSV